MLKQLGLVAVQGAVQAVVEQGTRLRCYDAVPRGTPAPFYFAQVVSKRPANTKTMFCDIFTLWLHCIAPPGQESTAVYGLVQEAEEALTQEISLPEGFSVLWQRETGLQGINTDPTNEKHAVVAYEIKVCYGFQTKN